MKVAFLVLGAAVIGGGALVALAAQDKDCAAAKTTEKIAEGFSCKLGVFTPAERLRHMQLSLKVKGSVSETRETEGGYAFKVDPAKANVMELAEWIDGERKCCPFFDLQMQIEPQGQGTWLKLAGAEGVKAFIRDELIGARPVVSKPKDEHAALQPWEPIDEAFRGCEEGCGKRGPNPKAIIQPGAKAGETAYCPVSGVAFEVKPNSPKALVGGKSVYFCCEGCAKHFANVRDEILSKRNLTASK